MSELHRAAEVHRAADVHGAVEERLRSCGQRYTEGRRSLVALLGEATSPLTVEEIVAALPLPRSSAYRHLEGLHAAGVVHRVASGDAWARYELAEHVTGRHHHHLLCESCGSVTDVDVTPDVEQAVRRHIEAAARGAGFEPRDHRIDVVGRCAACRPLGAGG